MNNNFKKTLRLAKAGDSTAKETIINMYLPLIYRKIYVFNIKSYPTEDLVQLGHVVILKCIDYFDLNKCIKAFGSYVSICLHNKYVDISRHESRERNTSYLSTEYLDGYLAINNNLISKETPAIDLVITNELSFNLQNCINSLTDEEKDLISALFIKEESKSLRNYAMTKNISYGEALRIRDRSYSKIRNSAYFKIDFINLIN